MSKNILFSIIVPVYNTKRERFKRCIDSILAQTYSNFEVIVVNDGSNDICLSSIQSICCADNRIKFISQVNKGAGPARNLGVQQAQGEYILFVDSDDMITNYLLDDAYRCLKDNDIDILGGGSSQGKGNGMEKSYL